MKFYHPQMAAGRWQKYTLIEQMANIGSEVFRAIKWKKKNKKYADLAFERALELFDLSLADSKNRNRLKEIARAREAFADYYLFDNFYGTSDKFWQNYFYAFNWAARNKTML